MHGVMTKNLFDLEQKIINAEFSTLKLLGSGVEVRGGGYSLVLFNGKLVENTKSELEINGLKVTKIKISLEGFISFNF